MATVTDKRDSSSDQPVTVKTERDAAKDELSTVEVKRDIARGEVVTLKAEREASRGDLATVKLERDAVIVGLDEFKEKVVTVKCERDDRHGLVRVEKELVIVKSQRYVAIPKLAKVKTSNDFLVRIQLPPLL